MHIYKRVINAQKSTYTALKIEKGGTKTGAPFVYINLKTTIKI